MASPAQTAPQFPPGYLAEHRQSYDVHSVAIAFIIIDTIALMLRVYSRRLQNNGISWGDGFMALSWVFNIAICITSLISLRYGVGRHIQALQPWQIKPYFQIVFYATPILYLPAATFPKLAVLDLYLHVFVNKFARWASWTTGAVLVLNLIVNAITAADQCRPVSQLWHPVPGGSCDNIQLHYMLSGLPNIVTDVVMLLLPLPMIWGLHTSKGAKIGIFLTLLVGNLGLVTSILRFVGFAQSYADPTWVAPEVLSWVIVEAGVYHICACLITYRSLLVWVANDSVVSPYVQKYLLSRSGRSSSGPQKSTMGDATRSFQRRWLARSRRNDEDFTLTSTSDAQGLQYKDESHLSDRKDVQGGIRVQREFETTEVHVG